MLWENNVTQRQQLVLISAARVPHKVKTKIRNV